MSWEWAEDQAKRSFMNRVCSKKRPFTVEEEFAYTCTYRPATHSKGTLQPALVACPILVDSPELEILIVKIRYTALRTPPTVVTDFGQELAVSDRLSQEYWEGGFQRSLCRGVP